MSWCDGDLVGFDTETTGKNPMTARLVTADVVTVFGEQSTELGRTGNVMSQGSSDTTRIRGGPDV